MLAQNPSQQALDELEAYVESFSPIDGWMIQAAVDGYKGGGYRQRWEMLISAIEDTASYAESIATLILGKNVAFKDGINIFDFQSQLIKLSNIFKKKGKVSKIDLIINRSLKDTLSNVTINGAQISSYDDCNIVLKYIELLEKRAKTQSIWDELMTKYGSPSFAMLGDEPEEICSQRIPNIRRYLDWYKNEFTQFRGLMNSSGLNSEIIFTFSDLDSIFIRTEKIFNSIKDIVPLYIRAAKLFLKLSDIRQRSQQSISVLYEGKRKNSNVCYAALVALHEKNADQYEEEYRLLSQLYEKYTLHAKRNEILTKLEKAAPGWAAAIRAREGIHGKTICPENIEQAWKWKQFAGIIEEITSEPYEELLKESVSLAKDLRAKTAELAANKAWYNLILRTENNYEMRQALMGWKLTVKRIGKGTGKTAPALRRRARELMAKCQMAVPAWIMPINKALESYDPSQNCFDVVIVDEASQADITALAILYFAKKVIIVGDNQQVSPMAVGIDVDRLNAIRDMYIKNSFDTWHLYDAKTSLYDIAALTYPPLMLLEHFRCVPEIIGYSNKLSYNFRIKPLRDASNCVIGPPVVSYRVYNGKREGYRKINTQEAETIVALMLACIEQPEYANKTFGVISLLGDDQAKLIQQLILRIIEPDVIEERRILCGNASHF